jgi:signal transduction histidine kinase
MHFVRDGASRMQAMIGDLLSFSRIANTDSKAAAPVSATACLQEAIWSVQATVQATGAAITHDELPVVRYHPQQLTQLFQNLIGNALKYRRAEPPAIYISAERRENEWIFSVRDNGLGFPPADAERIFGIFKRLHGREYRVPALVSPSASGSSSGMVAGSGRSRTRGRGRPSSLPHRFRRVQFRAEQELRKIGVRELTSASAAESRTLWRVIQRAIKTENDMCGPSERH